jgi:hypothetical protein
MIPCEIIAAHGTINAILVIGDCSSEQLVRLCGIVGPAALPDLQLSREWGVSVLASPEFSKWQRARPVTPRPRGHEFFIGGPSRV